MSPKFPPWMDMANKSIYLSEVIRIRNEESLKLIIIFHWLVAKIQVELMGTDLLMMTFQIELPMLVFS